MAAALKNIETADAAFREAQERLFHACAERDRLAETARKAAAAAERAEHERGLTENARPAALAEYTALIGSPEGIEEPRLLGDIAAGWRLAFGAYGGRYLFDLAKLIPVKGQAFKILAGVGLLPSHESTRPAADVVVAAARTGADEDAAFDLLVDDGVEPVAARVVLARYFPRKALEPDTYPDGAHVPVHLALGGWDMERTRRLNDEARRRYTSDWAAALESRRETLRRFIAGLKGAA